MLAQARGDERFPELKHGLLVAKPGPPHLFDQRFKAFSHGVLAHLEVHPFPAEFKRISAPQTPIFVPVCENRGGNLN
jgi:hypothetical protein